MTESTRLEPGQKAPDFTLTNDRGETVSLTDFAGQKVLLYFYPRANTPGCTKQACDFRDHIDEVGFKVIGISPDTPAKLAKFREDHDLNFELLSDPTKETMMAYAAFGEKKNYGKIVQGVIRSTFILDEDHTIEKAMYNVRATGHVGRVLKELP